MGVRAHACHTRRARSARARTRPPAAAAVLMPAGFLVTVLEYLYLISIPHINIERYVSIAIAI